MPSDRAPPIPPVVPGVTGALVSIETCATLMVAPPRLSTGPSFVPGINAVNAHSSGTVPVNTSDPSVDQNLAAGAEPVHSIASGVDPADDNLPMNVLRPPCLLRSSARAVGLNVVFSAFIFCALVTLFCSHATSSRPNISSEQLVIRVRRARGQFLALSSASATRRQLV